MHQGGHICFWNISCFLLFFSVTLHNVTRQSVYSNIEFVFHCLSDLTGFFWILNMEPLYVFREFPWIRKNLEIHKSTQNKLLLSLLQVENFFLADKSDHIFHTRELKHLQVELVSIKWEWKILWNHLINEVCFVAHSKTLGV